jgi:hypothetical protein
MRKWTFFWVVVVILAFQVGTLTGAQADMAGRLTQVKGRVDILKGGQLPATPAKVDAGVQTGDVIRTKSLSNAQITFIDNSTMTIAPESRVAIEEYMFDPAKQKRNSVIHLFQGLAHIVVNKVFKTTEPDFIVKTNTAIMGVRGTDFGIRIQPNSSTILNFKGRLQVGNIFPEVSQLSRRAFKVAHSFGPEGKGPGWVILKDRQGTTVFFGLPPTIAFTITKEDWEIFKRQLKGGLNICKPTEAVGGGAECSPTSTGALTGGGSDATGGNRSGFTYDFLMSLYSLAYTPPNVMPTTGTPSPSSTNGGTSPTPTTYNFSFTTYGLFCQCAYGGTNGFLAAGGLNGDGASPVVLNAYGLGILQGDWGTALPSLYQTTDSSIFTPTSGQFPSSMLLPGLYTSIIVGSVSGDLGGTLTGNATLESRYSCFKYRLSNNATIVVVIDPSGQITYTYADGSFAGQVYSFWGSTSISGGSTGEGTASPLFGSTTTASTSAGSETMTAMASSSDPTVLTGNSQSELTAAPAIAGASSGVPAATLGTSGVEETPAAHRRCGINRTFISPRNHGGRLEHRCVSTPRIQRNLVNLTRTGPMQGNLRGPGQGPTVTNFIRNCPITNPSVHLSRHLSGPACQAQRRLRGPQGGPRVVRHQKPKPAAHQGPCGQGPGGLHRPNLPGNPQVPACGQGNRGPQGPNPPGVPGSHQGPMTGNFGHQPRG